MSQAHDLHRALLRPAIIHTLRAAGFHSTKPSVLDTLVNLAERHLLLLASTTAQHAWSSHNDPVPTITDLRMALSDCGVLIPYSDPSEEAWKERMRKPLSEDTKDVREFTRWYDSPQYREIKRVAGIIPDDRDDFFTALKKKLSKAADDTRLQGTALGRPNEFKEVVVEGGPVQHVRDWKPKLEERSVNVQAQNTAERSKEPQDGLDTVDDIAKDSAMEEVEAAS
ncbi:uncharacterized protein MYCGRDRAFT_67149 [Zymoseptoria tritici IPO323]|uniref:Bromodomain associated domain-containing protein n=1 Tax=Zymoseptoria tritici (strain CBS 115943 / IPO323) TaxID=336722 RepID=F9WYG0_ZYMTI|nr:uncharacterized protein MYCGRDRAFT_67149 [Zymoseptoria tritici IPO323]EGP91617.1 hypothetical protein MYCGRDRAFT_67149 [Zymoseptoria tritici IPO323]